MKTSKPTKSTLKALHTVGYLLLIWGGVITGMDVVRYGIGNGYYWWFCNLALLAMGYGLVMEDRGLIIGFLAIASYTQMFWLLDNLSVLVTGQARFGLIEYMYQPGFPMDEFVLSHYHYFTIPLAIIAAFVFPKKGMSAVKKSLIGNPFIFGVSYFAFGGGQNVNCIHRACFPGWDDWTGPMYSIGFWLSIYTLHILCAYLLEEKVFPSLIKMADARKLVVRTMTAICAICVGLIAVDVALKSSKPQITCGETMASSEGAAISCKYIGYETRENLTVKYHATNPTSNRLLCKVEMQIGSATQLLHEELPLEPNGEFDYEQSIEAPHETVKVKFVSHCKSDGNQTAMLDE
jgi:hypothetical protein